MGSTSHHQPIIHPVPVAGPAENVAKDQETQFWWGGQRLLPALKVARPDGQVVTGAERWGTTSRGLRWTVTLHDDGPAWTAPITLTVRLPLTSTTQMWSAWADPRPEPNATTLDARGIADGILPIKFTGHDWADPLEPQPWANRRFWYGAPYYTYDNPRIAYCPFRRDVICMPFLTILEPTRDEALTVAVVLDGILLDLTLDVTEDGTAAYTHYYHRLGEGRTLTFALEFVTHAADVRAALGCVAEAYAPWLTAPHPQAHLISGTGAYSAQEAGYDADELRRMAFGVNWKASFDFPYMGLFIPPVGEEVVWKAFSGAPASIRKLRAYSQAMRADGFHVLNYFNVTEFGTRMADPAPDPLPSTGPDWSDPHAFLARHFPDAVLRIPDLEVAHDHQFYGRTQPGAPYGSWEGALVTDCGELAYQEFLLEQAQRHVDLLPESDGLCIDRLDWLRMYNHNRADGVSRIGERDVASLVVSWHALLARLGPLLHDAGKVLFVNNHTKRLDLLRHVDGIFDEFTYAGSPLNTTALLTLFKPALGWTGAASDLQPDPDAFFQRYLYLGVFPMAPFSGNDHALRPDPWVTAQYLRYGPLLNALRGRRWVLTPRAITVEDRRAKANLFTVPGGWVAPVTFAGDADHVVLHLKGLPASGLAADVLLPDQPEPLMAALLPDGDGYLLTVPVRKGCAMVRIVQETSPVK
jgi:hypothetical protein